MLVRQTNFIFESIMTVDVPHSLPKAEAEKRVKALLENVKSQFGNMIQDLHEDWQGDTNTFNFKMSGYNVSGTLQLHEKSLSVNLNLPLIATMFKGKIKAVIEEQGAKIFS